MGVTIKEINEGTFYFSSWAGEWFAERSDESKKYTLKHVNKGRNPKGKHSTHKQNEKFSNVSEIMKYIESHDCGGICVKKH